MYKNVAQSLLDAVKVLQKSENMKDGLSEAVKILEKTVETTTTSTYAQREHLDTRLADITDRKTPFLDRVSKKKANGITHEWDMITALGSNDTATAECGTPPDNEATITRYSAQIKTFASKVEVCDKAQWGASDYFDLMDLHLMHGMRKILQDVEKKCFYGDATGSPNEFDGIYNIVSDYASGNIVDATHHKISTTYIDTAIQAVIDNGGMPDTLWISARDIKDLATTWSSVVVYNDPSAGMTFGYNVARYMSYAGPIDITLNHFINTTNSLNTPYDDAFLLTMGEISMAESEPMYKLPVYRGLTLAETQSVVWNCVLELRIPQWMSIIKDIGTA
jgi:hypothetical protein